MIFNDKLQFDSSLHRYFVDGIQYTSVTTFIKKYEKEFLTEYIAQMYADKNGLDVNDVIQMWEDNRVNAARNGTAIHNSLEQFIKYGSIDNELLITNFLKLVSDGGLIIDSNTQSELRVSCDKLKLAGTFDLANFYPDGTYDLYDFKTGDIMKRAYGKMKEPLSHIPDCKMSKYSIQLEIYSRIIDNYGYKCRNIYFIWIKEDLSVEMVEALDMINEVTLLFDYEKDSKRRFDSGYIAHLL